MDLIRTDGKVMQFEMTKPTGVATLAEPHMHAVSLTLSDADTLTHRWAHFVDGRRKESVVFNFKRKTLPSQ